MLFGLRRALAAASLAVAGLVFADGCFLDWNGLDPRISSGGAGGSGGQGGSCPGSMASCEGTPGACETDLLTDPAHCGTCEISCLDLADPSKHTSGSCQGGTCGFVCANGWGDCDADPTDCETDLSTDTDCGGCDRACTGCQSGFCPPSTVFGSFVVPTRLVSTPDAVWVLAQNGAGASGVWKVADGMSPELFFPALPDGLVAPSDLAVDATHLYVADQDTDLVHLVPLDGSAPASFSATDVVDVASDGTNVWALQLDGGVRRAPKANPAMVDVVTNLGASREPTSLALLPAALPADTIALVALAGTPNAQMSWDADGRVLRLLPGNPTPEFVSTAERFTTDLVTTSTLALWVDKFGTLRRATSATWGVETLVDEPGYLAGVATASEYVYYTDLAQGFVHRTKVLAKPGDQPTLISAMEQGPNGVAVHGPWVYWVNQGNGQLRRAPK